ncbi:MAG: rhodanese-like domain-containing protein [Acetobacteraceae bacterium]
MAANVKDMLAAANAAVPQMKPDEVGKLVDAAGALIVDVRDPTEVQASGKVKGALNVSRGMLEFRADPESPYHNPAFRKDRKIVLYCGSGGRAALAGKTLQDLGFQAVFNGGGFKALADAGVVTEPA